MQKVVKIVWIGETRKGVSQKTGNEWEMTDIGVEWKVEQPGMETYTQSCVGSVHDHVNKDVLTKYKNDGKEILVTMYTNIRYYNEKAFTNVNIYLPKAMSEEPF